MRKLIIIITLVVITIISYNYKPRDIQPDKPNPLNVDSVRTSLNLNSITDSFILRCERIVDSVKTAKGIK